MLHIQTHASSERCFLATSCPGYDNTPGGPRSGSCLESNRAASEETLSYTLELAPVLLLVHQITRENLYLSVKAPVLLQPLFILTLGTSGFNCWGIETGSSHPEREHPNMSACQHIILIV